MPFFFMWSGVALIYDFVSYIENGISFPIIRIARTAIFYPKGAMWFILACIVAVILVNALWNYKKVLLSLCVLGYSFALLCNSYYFIVSDNIIIVDIINIYMKIFISARNGLFVGLPFFTLGIWLSKENNFINKRSFFQLIAIGILLFAFLIFEVVAIRNKLTLDDTSLFISIPFLAVVLLEISSRIRVNITNDLSILFRRLSGYLYFLHRAIISYLWKIVIIIFPTIKDNTLIEYVFVLSTCLIIWCTTKNSTNKFLRKILP